MTDNEDIQGQTGDEVHMPDITYKPGYNKLDSFNWLKDLPETPADNDIVEIRFKNTRKGFFKNVNGLRLEIGDVVAVEASPGHDIGRVSMVGHLVAEQLKRLKVQPAPDDLKKVYRKAKAVDIQKWEEAKKLETTTMLRSRKISEELRLNMKIGDVEYQGDKTKAIFYYIADERVDFRQLIKVLADEFRVRIEMRQIGARQEAGRIGGIASCGRELCCATHITNFISITTTHAKYQELSLNPQKLAGQCSKLKCCLHFELDCYVDAQRSFPPRDIPLEALDCTAYFQKLEVHKGLYWYSTDPHSNANLIAIPVQRVKEIQAINRKGKKVEKLKLVDESWEVTPVSQDLLKNNSLTRFDPPENKGQRTRISKRKKTEDSMIRGINKFSFIIALIFFLLISSCNNNVVYTNTQAMKGEIWKLADTPIFEVPVTDTLTSNNVIFTVRNGASFPFRNIYLFVSTTSPDGNTLTDTLQYNLADEKGKWYGKGFGDIHELNLPYKSNIYFPRKGIYVFKIQHGMRMENLKGIYDIGLKIVKIK